MASNQPPRTNWTCQRCNGKKTIGGGEPCPACAGEGKISRRRINSFLVKT